MLDQCNSKKQGDVGLGYCIAYCTRMGYCVSIPLTDSQAYDLIADCNGQLTRIQVKTTKYKGPSGSFAVSLTIKGGNRSFNTIKDFDPSKVDVIYILCEDGSEYLIPSNIVGNSITLGSKYQAYKL